LKELLLVHEKEFGIFVDLGHSFSVVLFLSFVGRFLVKELASDSVLARTKFKKVFANFGFVEVLDCFFGPFFSLSMSKPTLG
jgi:hypothetical protein